MRCDLKRLGKYEIVGELGRGAMGIVYKARDPIISRLVALKTITTNIADNASLLQRFYREAQSAGGLQHPNIVTIYDMGEEGGLPFIAMELIEGQNLEQIIARRVTLPVSLKLNYTVQACRALDYAHKRGIIHRDIKPGNVMVNKEGTVKVVDFGIARVLEASRTQTGMLIGTFAYMSPDQYHGEHADERSDIWSFGVLLYELLAYQRPFTGETPASLMQSICQKEPRPLREVASDCPPQLEAVVHRMLRKQASERFQSMEDVLLELDPICKSLQSESVTELVEESRRLAEQHDFPQARDLLRQALQVDSTNTQARSLLEKVNAELKRILIRPKAQECVVKGQALLEEGNLQEAGAEAEAALHLDSSFEPALELQRLVRQRLDRAQLIAEWLQAAKQRLAEGLPEEAEALLAKILELEPAHREARAFQKQVGEEKAERARRLQLLEQMQQARGLWTQQKYSESIDLLTRLQDEFPAESDVVKLLETVREDQAEQHRQQRLGEARRLLAALQFDECIKLLTELHNEFPGENEIPKLLESAREGQAEQQKQRQLGQARILLAKKSYAECIALLTELQQRFPRDAEVAELLKTAREDQSGQQKHARLEEARSLLAGQRFADCVALLTQLQKEFPRDPEPARLLEAARVAQAEQRKQQSLAEARNLLAARRYDDCLSLLSGLQKEFPRESEIGKLLETLREEQSEQKKKEQLAEARNQLATQRFAEALAILDGLLAAYPKDSAVLKLRKLVEQQQEEKSRLEHLQREREALKKLMTEKKYREAIAGAEKLLREFPGDHDLARLVEFARNQQAQIDQQLRLRKMLTEVQQHLDSGRFEEALQSAQSALKAFPGNIDFLRLRGQADLRIKERETRKLIEQRIREIKAQINRSEFSDAVSLARQTLATLGPDTDVSKLLSSAQMEIVEREKKREQDRRLEGLRTLLKSGKAEEATQVLDQALESKVLESFDPRVQRVVEEIEAAKAASAPPAAPAPDRLAREYALQQRMPPQSAPPAPPEAPKREAPAAQASAAQPVPRGQPAAPPPPSAAASLPKAPLAAPSVGQLPRPPVAPAPPPSVPKPPARDKEYAQHTEPPPSKRPLVPLWKRSAVLVGLAACIVGAVWTWIHFTSPKTEPPITESKPIKPAPNPLEVKQREALTVAEKLMAADNLEGARPILLQARDLNGPLTPEIQKKLNEVEKGIQDKKLRDLWKQEEQLWQLAQSDAASGRFAPAKRNLQQILSLPEGGRRRSEAQRYLNETLPKRQKEEQLFAQAQRASQGGDPGSLQRAVDLFGQVIVLGGPRQAEAQKRLAEVGAQIHKLGQEQISRQIASLLDGARQDLKRADFRSARQKAGIVRQLGGDPVALTAEIDLAEQSRFTQLEGQLNQLKQHDDDAAARQLKDLQTQFQALAESGGPRAAEARNDADSIPGFIGEVQARARAKSFEAAFQQAVQRYQSLANSGDKAALESARTEFQAIARGGGPRAADAQRYVSEIGAKIAPLVPPPSPPQNVDRDAVLAVVTQYSAAQGRKDLDAILKIWPGIPGSLRQGIQDLFRTSSSIKLDLQPSEPQVSGNSATVAGRFASAVTGNDGQRQSSRGDFIIRLEKKGSSWVIVSLEFHPRN